MHEGHRRRMYEKLKNDDGLYDHELLEILLFNALPRKNTNPIAHALLQQFGSLSDVLAAEPEQLVTVEGVGESVAMYLKCVGECVKRIGAPGAGIAVLKTYDDFRQFAALRMRGRVEETLELYLLEKNGKVKRICSFTDNERNKVVVGTEKVAEALAAGKPYGLLIAHNHLSGDSTPSVNDDKFTMEAQLMCSMYNVVLYDHCIYASDKNIYSYYLSGKIDEIKKNFNFRDVVDKQFKENMLKK